MQSGLLKSTVRLGLYPRQWALLILIMLVPITINFVAIWEDIGIQAVTTLIIDGHYDRHGGIIGKKYNPLPAIFRDISLVVAILGLPCWLIAFVSTRTLFQNLPKVLKGSITIVSVSFLALVFSFVTADLLPLIWLPKFHEYMFGLPTSSFMVWGWFFALPITFSVLSWMLYAS